MPPAALICSARVGSLGPSSMRVRAADTEMYVRPPGEKKMARRPSPFAFRAPTFQSTVSCSAASALALNFGIAFVATRFDLGVRSGLSASGFLGAAGAAPSVGSAARKIASASVCAAGAVGSRTTGCGRGRAREHV